MKLAFEEPLVVEDFVLCHIVLHLLDVLGKCKADECAFALLARSVYKAVAVYVCIFLCKFCDVCTLIAVLGKLNFIALENLKVTSLKRTAELFNLIACVVNVELTPYAVACLVKHCGKAVAERTASCVAHMHRTCWVCRNELNHYLFVCTKFTSAVIFGVTLNLFDYV